MAALLAATGAPACDPGARRLGWEIVFADAALAARAARVEGRILAGGCASATVRYAAEAGPGESPAAPPRLEPGRYGFAGSARDAACVEFAIGCVEIDVPRAEGETVTVTLTGSADRALCAAAACSEGRCGGAGDAGAPDAPGADVPGLDAPARDGGCTLDSECGTCGVCELGTCTVAPDATACSGGAGRCRAGACCTGCWDGGACAAGDAPSACGIAGTACASCGGSTPLCSAGGTCAAPRLVSALALGNAFACAVADDGTLWCWGDNTAGQLGAGTSGAGTALDAPARVGTRSSWTGVGAGDAHVCAAAGAELSCWGDNENAQLGFADLVSRDTPAAVPGATGPWAHIDGATVGDATYVLEPSGAVRAMGQNDYGQLGLGDNTDHTSLDAWAGTWRSVAGGHHFACGVQTDGTLWCTGRNQLGQLGLGTSGIGTDVNTPTRVGAETTWTRVEAGDVHACALRGSGELWCWGSGGDGRLGRGSTAAATAPVRVGTDADWTDVALGLQHTCGIRAGALYCWGDDTSGQLGLGASPPVDVTSPARVGSASDWEAVLAGGSFTCGLRAGGALYCWGANAAGQLGAGDVAPRRTPVAIVLPPG